MPTKRTPAQTAATVSPSTTQPTEAQIRTTDLETQDADSAEHRTAREEAIRQAAYEAYLRRGGTPGGELDDWLEAERRMNDDAQPQGGPRQES